jgi:sulfur-carrier protein adenylyltransferase/sulfurtransferase
VPQRTVTASGPATLTADELRRYGRHIRLPQVGVEGQERLKAAKVLVVGLGGLGSPAALYLAAAGVGTLGLVEHDRVDESNLQRQVLYSSRDVGRAKIEAAAARLKEANPHVEVRPHPVALTSANALEIIQGYDVVIDASDNFPTRYLVNDACVLTKRPYVYGSIFQFEGQVSVFASKDGPCYRCVFPSPPPPGSVPDCEEAGVLGVLAAVVGSLQANEAIKIVLGIGKTLHGQLLVYDALDMEFLKVALRKDPKCAVCGPMPTVKTLIDYDRFCGVAPAAPTRPTTMTTDETTTDVVELKRRLDAGEDVFLLDVREPQEAQVASIPGGVLIPMNTIPSRLDEIPRDKPIICYCRVGARSMRVAGYLRQQGYSDVKNLTGGIMAWIDEIDPSLPKY